MRTDGDGLMCGHQCLQLRKEAAHLSHDAGCRTGLSRAPARRSLERPLKRSGPVERGNEPRLQPDLAFMGVGPELAGAPDRVVVAFGLEPVGKPDVAVAVETIEAV